jgi:hypothetical protein
LVSDLTPELKLAEASAQALASGDREAAKRLALEGLALPSVQASVKWMIRFKLALALADHSFPVPPPLVDVNETEQAPIVCSFCGTLHDAHAGSIVAGPDVFICRDCARCLSDGPPWPPATALGEVGMKCSFCAQPGSTSGSTFVGGSARICRRCVETCIDIFFGSGGAA